MDRLKIETIKYVMLGEDGFYTFEDTWDDLPRQIGMLTYNGFTLIGVDGCNGFKAEPTPGARHD